MPKLNEYICVGFCSSYGDHDYSISSQVADLSRERLTELMAAMQWASKAALEMWLDAERKRNPDAYAAKENRDG